MKTTALTPLQWKVTKDGSVSEVAALRVGIIAVGCGGCEMLPQVVAALGQTVMSTIALHTDIEELAASLAQHRLHFNNTAKEAWPEDLQAQLHTLQPVLATLQVVFLLAHLGDEISAHLSPTLADLLAAQKSPCVAVVTTPFEYEGGRRQRRANEALQSLQGRVPMLCEVSGDLILEQNSDITQTEAVETTTEWTEQICRSVLALLDPGGLVALDWQDIQQTFGSEVLVMGKGTATGPQAPLRAFVAALDGPLLNAETLRQADAVLVVLEAVPEMLQLWQVRDLMATVRKTLSLDAEMLFSAVPVAEQDGAAIISIFIPKIEYLCAPLPPSRA